MGGSPAYRMALCPNPADLEFDQNTSAAGQFARKRKLRATAQESLLKEIANRQLRRILDRNRIFEGTYTAVGDQLPEYPERAGPVIILAINETEATAAFRSQTVKIA